MEQAEKSSDSGVVVEVEVEVGEGHGLGRRGGWDVGSWGRGADRGTDEA